ncbi:MAG: ABC-2 type transport system permease protein [Cyclobacteriaceae bacterium]|jgi:ABC-2 type transport system permease protein
MNNVWLILEREYLERVKKKSFLIATLLTPLIFPLIIGVSVFLTKMDQDEDRVVYVVDETGWFSDGFTIDDYTIQMSQDNLDETRAKLTGEDKDIYGVLHIPAMELSDPQGISFYSKTSPGFNFLGKFKDPIRDKIRDMKMTELNLDRELVDQLRTSFDIATFNVSESGESKKSSSAIASGLGYVMAFLMYMFVFIYGGFILQSVNNEKTNKIIEVIVSSVRPFHLMMGKVLGVGAVALTQFAIWITLMVVFTVGSSVFFGYTPASEDQQAINEAVTVVQNEAPEMVKNMLDVVYSLPIAQILTMFIIYFLGGFLLYGGLFAAVGSAVDTIQEAQQFMLPITLPIIASIVLMSVVLANPDSATSITLTLIPFTSPILMMARIPFGVPGWQIFLSVMLLIGGFLGTLWIAGRIYRIGILTSGSKVTYKTLAKWLTMKY